MNGALGLVEFLKVPTGMLISDKMAKASNIEIIHAATVCPGKYIVLFKGTISEVKEALDVAKFESEENIIDSFLLGNPVEDIYKAITGCNEIIESSAVGIVESYSVASIIEAADIAAKSAKLNLVEVRLARGMCGKSFFIVSGDISAVEMGLSTSKKMLKEKGMLLDDAIINNPDKGFIENLY